MGEDDGDGRVEKGGWDGGGEVGGSVDAAVGVGRQERCVVCPTNINSMNEETG